MKQLILGSFLLSSSITAMAEGVFLGGATLYPDSSLACGSEFCGSVEVEYDLELGHEPVNTDFAMAGEGFFNPTRGYFYDTYTTDNGVAYIDRDAIAAKYNEAGFYLLTKSYVYGRLPTASEIELSNVDFDYDEAAGVARVSFDWETDTNPFEVFNQFALYMNHTTHLTDHLRDWKIEGGQKRRIVVNSAETLDRIDVHAVIDGQAYNFQMSEQYSNFYSWDIPPTVADNAEIHVFFNYSVGGYGVNTPTFEENLGNLREVYSLSISSFYDTITLSDQTQYPLMGELGLDSEKLEVAYVTYKINGGAEQAYKMDRVITQDDGFRFATGVQHTFDQDIVKGDTVEYRLQYIYKGVSYSTAWESQTLSF